MYHFHVIKTNNDTHFRNSLNLYTAYLLLII